MGDLKTIREVLYVQFCKIGSDRRNKPIFDDRKKKMVDKGIDAYFEFKEMVLSKREHMAARLISSLAKGNEIMYNSFRRALGEIMPDEYRRFFKESPAVALESDINAPTLKELFYDIAASYNDKQQKRQAESGVDRAFNFINNPVMNLEQAALYFSGDAPNPEWNAFRYTLVEMNHANSLRIIESRIYEIVIKKKASPKH